MIYTAIINNIRNNKYTFMYKNIKNESLSETKPLGKLLSKPVYLRKTLIINLKN